MHIVTIIKVLFDFINDLTSLLSLNFLFPLSRFFFLINKINGHVCQKYNVHYRTWTTCPQIHVISKGWELDVTNLTKPAEKSHWQELLICQWFWMISLTRVFKFSRRPAQVTGNFKHLRRVLFVFQILLTTQFCFTKS